MTENIPLRVLAIEDSENDAALIARQLEKAGYAVTLERVETAEQLTAALAKQSWDIVAMDYKLPHFDAMTTLSMLRATGLDIPFIVISGAISDEAAVAMMRAGAHDYLMKGNLARLGLAVQRELVEAQNRKQRRQLENEWRLGAAALNAAANAIVITDRQGAITWINPAWSALTGYSTEESIGQNPRILKSGVQPAAFYQSLWDTILSGQVWHSELANRRKDGSLYHEDETITPVRDAAGEITHFIGIKRDITARKQAQEALVQRTTELGERVKELGCLYEISRLIAESDKSVDDVFKGAVHLLPPAWFYPEIACARIAFKALEFTTENFRETPWKLAADIVTSEEKWGAVEVFYLEERPARDEGPFLKEERALLDTLAREFESMLGRKQAQENLEATNRDLERRTRELAALNSAGQLINSNLDLDAVLSTIMVQIKEVLDAEGCSILLHEGDDLVFAAAAGIGAEKLIGLHMLAAAGIAGQALYSGQSILVNDAHRDPNFYDQIDGVTGLQTQSLMAVPLMIKGTPHGVIEAINKLTGTFDERDLSLLESIAASAATAMDNARLFAAVSHELIEHERAALEIRALNKNLERRAQELSALNRSGQAITAAIDLESVQQLVLAEVKSLLNVAAAAVSLRVAARNGEGYDLLLTLAGDGLQPQNNLRLPDSVSIIGPVIQSGQSVLLNDVAANESHQPEHVDLGEKIGIKVSSLLAVPLMFKGSVEGSVAAFNKLDGPFEQHDLEILEVITYSAAIAFKNAQLYRHLERTLVQEQRTRAQLIQAGKLNAMGRMVASIAHELNNPLQTIQNCLFLVQADVPAETKSRQFLDIAMVEVKRLSNLVAQLRTVYRPSVDDQQITLEVSKILDEVQLLLAPYFAEHAVRWEYVTPPGAYAVTGVVDQLKQVFLNLGLNAADAMRPNGGTLRVEVLLRNDGRQVGVAFRDSGVGIDPADLPNLFDPFFITKETGVGLGLAICYDIIHKHGGNIAVDSQPGQGATFTVWLPLASE
jgi:PAS domain S-box-containing protein